MRCRHLSGCGECSAMRRRCSPRSEFCEAVIRQYCQDKKTQQLRKTGKALKKINAMAASDWAAAIVEAARREAEHAAKDEGGA